MLNKKEVQQAGYEVIDSAAKLPTEQAEKVSQIKSILPSLVNSDGMVSVAALKDLLGEQNFASSSQGYSLNFAGKGLAKIKADEPTTKCLKIEEKQSKKFATTGNVIIHGDNLDVLKILRQNYTGKIKMIYIDPPYNTGSANFVYADNFRVKEAELIKRFGIDEDAVNFFENMFGTQTHSSWLFAMYPRLKLARDLLTDDGVIFISIDDNEQANLKLLCDEVFGEDNFINLIATLINLKGNNSDTFFSGVNEYGLIYAKNKSSDIAFNLLENNGNWEDWSEDDKGYWKRGGILSASVGKTPENTQNDFPVYVSENDNVALTRLNPTDVKVLPFSNGKKTRWYWSAKTFEAQKDEVIVVRSAKGISLYTKQRMGIGEIPQSRPKTVFYKPSYGQGTNDLKNVFGFHVFSNPKSVSMLKDIFFIFTGKDAIVLDFFSGSGTTAEAVMRLNAEDGGNRKFILAQWDETIDKKSSSEAYKFCIDNQFKPVISSITIERVKRAGEKIKKENGSLTSDLDIGYKVFSLTDRPVLEKTAFSEGTIKEVLYNMMTASGEVLLTSPIEEIEKNLLYKVGNSYFVLGECKISLKQFSSNRIYINGYANIRLERWLNMLGLDKDNIKVLYY